MNVKADRREAIQAFIEEFDRWLGPDAKAFCVVSPHQRTEGILEIPGNPFGGPFRILVILATSWAQDDYGPLDV
jgi:hypothetical protein